MSQYSTFYIKQVWFSLKTPVIHVYLFYIRYFACETQKEGALRFVVCSHDTLFACVVKVILCECRKRARIVYFEVSSLLRSSLMCENCASLHLIWMVGSRNKSEVFQQHFIVRDNGEARWKNRRREKAAVEVFVCFLKIRKKYDWVSVFAISF